jgi:hypothetical protein
MRTTRCLVWKRFPSASAVMPSRCACPDRTSVWQNLGL